MLKSISVPQLRTALKPLKGRVKAATQHSFWLRYLTLAALTGRTMAGSYITPVNEAVDHAKDVFSLFKKVAGIERFRGKVVDVGPGDCCALGLLFLADGCEHVDLADRFTFQDSQLQRDINRAIISSNPQLSSRLRENSMSESSIAGLQRHSGNQASAEAFFEAHQGYDYIVSAATLEHVIDPLMALEKMSSALKPGGTMIHGVDFRDHGQFSEAFHDLKFLELPEVLYAPLRWQGGPNRVRLSAYVNKLSSFGFSVEVFAGFVAGIKEEIPPCRMDSLPQEIKITSMRVVSEARPHLSRPFRNLSDEDLMAAGVVIVARKPQ
jgi:SAM-dependent methyltransferase